MHAVGGDDPVQQQAEQHAEPAETGEDREHLGGCQYSVGVDAWAWGLTQ